MKMKNFADRLLDAIDSKRNPSIIGLDPDLGKMPAPFVKGFSEGSARPDGALEAAGRCILAFNREIIDHISDIVPAVKLQSAFYEQYGQAGCGAFVQTAKYAKGKGLIVIGDVKRSDIGNTSRAYSSAYLGMVTTPRSRQPGHDLDGITVNPYLGSDGVKPFIEDCREYGKGIFVLVKTSNPSSAELQDIDAGGRRVYESVAGLVNGWGDGLVGSRGYSSVGAVVGATQPQQAEGLRKMMPRSIFLVPGYGAQGGSTTDIVPCFNPDGCGAVIHSARAVIFAHNDKASGKNDGGSVFGPAARDAAMKMKDDIVGALREKGISPW